MLVREVLQQSVHGVKAEGRASSLGYHLSSLTSSPLTDQRHEWSLHYEKAAGLDQRQERGGVTF